MDLTGDINQIKGVGPKTKACFERLDIYTVNDLMEHYPRSYQQYQPPISMDDTSFDDKQAAAYLVQITESAKLLNQRKVAVVTLHIACTPVVQAVWYRSPYVRQQLPLGATVILYGKIIHKGKKRLMEHPEIFTKEQYMLRLNHLQPLYGLTEGLTQNFMIKTLQIVLDNCGLQNDELPHWVRERYHLAERNFAIKQIHFPDDQTHYLMARRRLAFDEFLIFTLGLKMMKLTSKKLPNHFQMSNASKIDTMIQSLPYQLTGAQLRVWQEIKQNLESDTVMNRLVQGDVGSGKTMIAALAMFYVAVSGYQSCMMAPTEVLARQHYANLSNLFAPFGIRVGLLTGSMTTAQKRQTYGDIEAHEIDVIIGTQALFQEKAIYHKLALIVTDEQHRFGVRQRERLASKGDFGEPHVLVMSATPIPRTLALILYSDLDISIVDEKPANRLPIKNCVVGTAYRPTAYHFIEKQIALGHQVYVICPMVEESEFMEAENVVDYTALLKKKLSSDIRVDYLHGKMKADEKNELMQRFSDGLIDVLVSTTVIEVGVDVANATVMMIENAERFGLAQLHQLRGRVGRGKDQSYCIFIAGQDSQKVKDRLDIMVKTNDGFKIAAEDLKLRGPGDLLGIRQSGSILFKIGDVFSDAETLMQAGEAADRILTEDPTLTFDINKDLKEKIERLMSKGTEQITL